MEDLKEIGGIILMLIFFVLWMLLWGNPDTPTPRDHDMGTFESYDGSYP